MNSGMFERRQLACIGPFEADKPGDSLRRRHLSEYLDFVGPRNELFRFPSYTRTEIGIEHRFKIFKLQPWIGVRAYNAFDAFLPTDVQANITSPAFGTYYNSEYRQLRLQFRFER